MPIWLYYVYTLVVLLLTLLLVVLLLFKQETVYEMRISDWSSDVCSSNLGVGRLQYIKQADEAGRAGTRGVKEREHGWRLPRVCECREKLYAPRRTKQELSRFGIDRKSTRLNSSH